MRNLYSRMAKRMNLQVMTFNVRRDSFCDLMRGRGWPQRRAAVYELINSVSPDIVGLQEVRAGQMSDLRTSMLPYQSIGSLRGPGRQAESVPILVSRDRFEILEFGDFWLSPTPEIPGSRGWDAAFPRLCTWVWLRDFASGIRFAIFNTHLDHRGAASRLEGAKIISERLQRVALPSILIGDMNDVEGSEVLRTFERAGYGDVLRAIGGTDPSIGTLRRGDRRLDFILADGAWQVESADVLDWTRGKQAASDHRAVTACLSVPN